MRSLLRLTPVSLVLVALVFTGADAAYRATGDAFIPGGPLDETAHLLTALIVLWALGPWICERFMAPALVASVAIDLDHVPQYLGDYIFTRGTPRPYTHSLLTIAVVLAAALIWRRRRDMLVGVGLGLVIHFWRDLSESHAGVSLLWPLTDRSFTLPHTAYLLVMAAFVVAAAARLAVGDERVGELVP